MLIVDSQVHIWAADTPERPWPKRGHPHRPLPLGADGLLTEMDAAGVGRVVLVPAAWEGDRNDLALAAARARPGRFAVMGRLDPRSPAARGVIATLRRQPGMLGLRFSFNSQRALLTEGHMEWVWSEAETHRVPLFIMIPHSMLHLVDDVATRHPRLKLAIDHMGLATDEGKDAAAFREFDKVLAIARHPNVAAKISALPCFTTDTYPYRSLHSYIRSAYDAFGPKRLFWGTDFSRSPIPYRQHVTLFTEELPWLSGGDLEWIMGRGVCEWLGWRV